MRAASIKVTILISFILIAFFGITLVQVAYAGKEVEFKEYLNQAKELKESVSKSAASFAPEKVFEGYNSNPAPSRYYSEDSASASQTLKSDGILNLTTNKEGQAIAESSKTRPQFKINSESEEIKGSKKIQTLASKNVKGILEGFISGEEEQIKTKGTKYVIKTCNEEIRPLKRICIKAPEVKIVSQSYQEVKQYSGTTRAMAFGAGVCTASFTLPVSGTITSINLTQSGLFWGFYNGYLQGTHISSSGNYCYINDAFTTSSQLYFSNSNLNINVESNVPIAVLVQGSHGPGGGRFRQAWSPPAYNLSIKTNVNRNIPQITWSEVCHEI